MKSSPFFVEADRVNLFQVRGARIDSLENEEDYTMMQVSTNEEDLLFMVVERLKEGSVPCSKCSSKETLSLIIVGNGMTFQATMCYSCNLIFFLPTKLKIMEFIETEWKCLKKETLKSNN